MEKELTYRLSNPNYTIYHRAALGGLAATIRAWGTNPPDGITAAITRGHVRLAWSDQMTDQEALRRILGACPRINVYRSLIPRQLYGVGVEMDIAVVSTSTAVSTSRFIGGMTPYKGILVEHMAPSMESYTVNGVHA